MNDLEQQLRWSLGIERPGGVCTLIHPKLSHAVVGAAIDVHRHLGPGKLESVYQAALAHELLLRGISFRAQVPIAMDYKGVSVGEFFADFVVDEKIIVELKAVERVLGVHTAQVLSYLRAANLRIGLLINFNEAVVHRGVKRLVL